MTHLTPSYMWGIDPEEIVSGGVVAAPSGLAARPADESAASHFWVITDIILRTDRMRPHGQDIVVLVQLDDGRQVEVIRSFGAMPDISIDHYVTHHGISEAIARSEVAA